jgi:hypothetical protein
MPINHFLLIYDIRARRLDRFTSFGTDVEQALHAYAELEREYRDRADNENFEIVLLGADSRATLEHTHSRYFTERDAVPF